MPAYNFQRRFAPLIQCGEKRSTIRARRKNGYVPAAGEQLKLYTGQRTRNCHLLGVVTVKSVRPIAIYQYTSLRPICGVVLNGEQLGNREMSKLAATEGFKSLDEFLLFFKCTYGDAFCGYLIEW